MIKDCKCSPKRMTYFRHGRNEDSLDRVLKKGTELSGTRSLKIVISIVPTTEVRN